MLKNVFHGLLLIVAFVWIFGLGLIFGRLLTTHPVAPTNVAPPDVSLPARPLESYDIIIAATSEPHTLLVLDFFELDSVFTGNAHYFDGKNWAETPLRKGEIKIQEVEGLNQFTNKITGNFLLNGNLFVLDIPSISTPMVIRGESNFVKFGGTTHVNGPYLKINETAVDSYVALMKGFAKNYPAVYIEELGINTTWLAFWDKDWNFYHLDKTLVKNPSPDYTPHEFFSKITPQIGKFGFGSVEYYSGLNTNVASALIKIGFPENLEYKEMELTFGPQYSFAQYYTATYVTSEAGGVGLLLQVNTPSL